MQMEGRKQVGTRGGSWQRTQEGTGRDGKEKGRPVRGDETEREKNEHDILKPLKPSFNTF